MKAPRNGYSLGILQRLDIPHALRSLRDRFESLVMILQYQANILRHDHHLHFVGGDVHLAAHEHEVANLGPFSERPSRINVLPYFYITEQSGTVLIASRNLLFIKTHQNNGHR